MEKKTLEKMEKELKAKKNQKKKMKTYSYS